MDANAANNLTPQQQEEYMNQIKNNVNAKLIETMVMLSVPFSFVIPYLYILLVSCRPEHSLNCVLRNVLVQADHHWILLKRNALTTAPIGLLRRWVSLPRVSNGRGE